MVAGAEGSRGAEWLYRYLVHTVPGTHMRSRGTQKRISEEVSYFFFDLKRFKNIVTILKHIHFQDFNYDTFYINRARIPLLKSSIY